MQSAELGAAPGPPNLRRRWLAAGLVLSIAVAGTGLAVDGEPRLFGAIGLEIIPLILLAGFNQLGIASRGWRIVAWIWFWLVLATLASLTVGVLVGTLSAGSGTAGSAELRPNMTALTVQLVMVVAAVIGAVLVATRGWIAVARASGGQVQASSPGEAQGTVGLLYFALLGLVSLVALQGQPLLLRALETTSAADTLASQGEASQVLSLYYELAWALPFGLLAAGFPLKRGLRASIERLGFTAIRWRLVPVLLIAAAALVGISFLLDSALGPVWDLLGWPRTNNDLVRKLFGATTTSFVGAISVALEAGFAEEMVFRGLFQPRLGWLLANLGFAAAHAFQYGPDGLAVVFVLGGAQAIIRARWNTTAASVTHGAYNFFQIVGALLGLPGF